MDILAGSAVIPQIIVRYISKSSSPEGWESKDLSTMLLAKNRVIFSIKGPAAFVTSRLCCLRNWFRQIHTWTRIKPWILLMPPLIDVITSFKPANSLDPMIWTWQMDNSRNPPSLSSTLPVCACMYNPYLKPAHCYAAVARDLLWTWHFSPTSDPVALYIHLSFWHSLSPSACQQLSVMFHRAQARPVLHRQQCEGWQQPPHRGRSRDNGSCRQSPLLPPAKAWTLVCFLLGLFSAFLAKEPQNAIL